MRPVAKAASATALVDGPSHDTCLPGRPPNHWLWPSRESVVIALLPWRARVTADSVRPPVRTRRPASIVDRIGPFRALAKVVRDGPPVGLRSHPKFYPIRTRTPPTPPGGRPGRGESSAIEEPGARATVARVSTPRTAIRTGPPVSDRSESFRPIHGARDQESPALTDAAPIASGLSTARRIPVSGVAAGRAEDAAPHSALCPILRRPRVNAPCPRAGRV
jgi:hypothetical protein